MRMLFTLLCILSWSLHSRAAEQVEGTWEVLEGCRLVKAHFNDGDSFQVAYRNEKYSFRLYFVDAPETSETYIDRVRDQARYFSIPEQDVTNTGKLASSFTQNFLRGEFTVITQWEDARGSSHHQRYFALIQKGEQFLSSELIRAGLARLYGKPTENRWPGGLTPRTFLARLKEQERKAQHEEDGIWALATGSMQMSGLESLIHRSGINSSEIQAPHTATGTSLKDRLNINTATSAELQELPGIGQAYAARIIAARPIESIESLIQIPGISANTLADFSHMIVTEDPPPPAFTFAFYQANIEKYLNTEVTVHIAAITASDADSPESFRAVQAHTAYNGEDGGAITAYIPDEFYDSFINYYREPNREFTGLLHTRAGEVVMVYVRK
ncbi:helix-hairpin-helix domain-containing protein [Coraliomargarita sp. SDUM461004]|uniref:Helix-hairpin-helix domain-containing protein n=1 Tax=Thalassobacterium sedimentorum TaxID=3041258 RepID=A0ABU1AJD4_9BACT|nr:helix-hairpin-helix domain-containing protein [Coraliomargarita sp. SDUM461004]MDQ8194910.1 helix-hairpin-helix domain-containing protein [Coraliomargarita sp. SDUM461004]